MTTAIFVATRIIANPVSNVFQKRLTDATANPLFIIAATHMGLTMVALPFLARTDLTALTAAFWLNMTLSAVLAVVGKVNVVGYCPNVPGNEHVPKFMRERKSLPSWRSTVV